MKRLKKLFNVKDVKKSDSNSAKGIGCSEEWMKRFEKTISYDHWFDVISHIEFGKWELQQDRPNGKYVWKFSNWLTVEIRNNAYVTVTIKRGKRKYVDKFYLNTIDEAFYLMRWIVYAITD